MSDFEEIAEIYESFQAVSNGQYSPAQGQPSYRRGQLPTAAPGNANAYQANQIPQTTSPVADEETNPILHKIIELMAEAERDEIPYAIHQLGSLKKFVEEMAD